MWELYLLTRLGVIFPILVFIAALAGIVSAIAGIDILCEGDVERSTKIFKRSAVPTIWQQKKSWRYSHED